MNHKIDYESRHVRESIEQIAKVCSVSGETLLAQYQDVHPRAMAVVRPARGNINKIAWKLIVDKIQAHHMTAKNHPMDVLKKALVLYFVFGISSSGVEQAFSKSRWGFSNRRLAAYPETEEYVLRVILAMPSADLKTIIPLAQKVWTHVYGPTRRSNDTPRISKGVPKTSRNHKPALADGMAAHTEKEFVQSRRAAASSLAGESARPYANMIEINEAEYEQPGWLDEHSKEVKFQKDKLQARKVQCVAEKVIDADGDASLEAAVPEERRKRIKAQRARERKAQRADMALNGSTGTEVLAKIAGCGVHVDSNLMSDELQQSMEQLSMKRVEAHEANAFVVEVPGRGGLKVALASGLRGAYHVTPEFIISKGSIGVAVKYHFVAGVHRVVYVSQAVSLRNKAAIGFFQKVLANIEDSQVELVVGKDWDALRDLKIKHKSKKSKLIAIVRTGEVTDPARNCVIS